jgi:hypothetical protein
MTDMPANPAAAGLPVAVAHADWGCDLRKRQVALATLQAPAAGPQRPQYRVTALAAAPGDLIGMLATVSRPGSALLGFDFTIGLPRAYAAAAGVPSFSGFLDVLGTPPWTEFELVARRPEEISLLRPFYPDRPGGTRREHLYAGLGLSAAQVRRRCDGTDAETLFWTLGSKQAGKASLSGWRLLRQARARAGAVALWPFDGDLARLIGGPAPVVVAEAYPREFYRFVGAPPRGRWSKRRREDRLLVVPRLLAWAESLGVRWDEGVGHRVRAGFSAGPAGEDEFDAVVGLLGLLAVVTKAAPEGLPADDPAVLAVEGWILGRQSSPSPVKACAP